MKVSEPFIPPIPIEGDFQLTVVDRQGTSHSCEGFADMGLNLMELLKAHEFPVQAICEGMGLCGTCHVYIDSAQELPPLAEAEELVLDDLPHMYPERSRLACQVPLTPEIAGATITLAPEP